MADPIDSYANLGTLLSDVVPESIRWIAPNRIALGFLTVIDGDPGVGKSTLITDWIARITRGDPVLDGPKRPPAGVVLVSGEDHLSAVIQPRMVAAGADLSRVLFLNQVPTLGALPTSEHQTHPIAIPGDLFYIEAAVANVGARLLVVDPIMLFFDESVNTNLNGSVRRAIGPLVELAERRSIAILLVRHLNKMGTGPAIYRGEGSIAINAAARLALLVGRNPDDEDQLVIAGVKENIGKKGQSLAYRIISDEHNPDVGRVVYDGPVNVRADDLTGYIDRQEREERASCRVWLEGRLAFGAVDHKTLQKDANAAGFSPTLLRAMLTSIGANRLMMGGIGVVGTLSPAGGRGGTSGLG